MFEIVFNRKLSERIYYSSIVLFPWACLITSDFVYEGDESVRNKKNIDEFEAIDDKNDYYYYSY